MSPLPGWLGGAQCVALNFSAPDLSVQLHFALFHGSGGFVLKPPEMVARRLERKAAGDAASGAKGGWPNSTSASASEGGGDERSVSTATSPMEVAQQLPSEKGGGAGESSSSGSGAKQSWERSSSRGRDSQGALDVSTEFAAWAKEKDRQEQREKENQEKWRKVDEDDAFWPPPRSTLHRTTIEVLSLHNLPKTGERRPRFSGSRGSCHAYHRELLSGLPAPPNDLKPSSPALLMALHPLGGFCALCRDLPLRVGKAVETEMRLSSCRHPSIYDTNSLNVLFGSRVNCLAAEPRHTFIRVSVTAELGREVAYESAVLGRLRRGYRVFQLRGVLGTRIELCYLFVKISFGSEKNLWPSPRQLRMQRAAEEAKLARQEEAIAQQEEAMEKMKAELTELRRQNSSASLGVGTVMEQADRSDRLSDGVRPLSQLKISMS